MTRYQALLQPFQLRHLTLRNRIMSTSHEPAYSEQGRPGLRYRLYHEEKAKGGIALTMIGGSAVGASPPPPPAGPFFGKGAAGLPVRAPSRVRGPAPRSSPRAMEDPDIRRIVCAYGAA